MSEMAAGTAPATGESVRNSVQLPFRCLRLMIAPAYPNELIISLVTHPLRGHPTLHPEIRQLRTLWFPSQHAGDLEPYALGVAMLRVAQTRS